ncbi:response regulator transcription factor [Paraglaciecola sp.]|uniref:response regulator transcription factor n=1 Tax=Paraglaciecola sp. TaxID=1920173 RepID=UPI0030F493F8
MTDHYHVVLAEDDEILLAALGNALSQHEFKVSRFTHGQAALEFIKHSQQDSRTRVHILVSDVQLPDITGLALIDKLKDDEPLGKILISVKDRAQDKISGLLAGADDYLGKPIDPDELLLRIRTLIKRLNFTDKPSYITFLDFKLNPENNMLIKGTNYSVLGASETQLLLLLIGQQGKVVGREHIVQCLGDEYTQGRSLDMLVSRLRKKLDDEQNKLIVTYRRRGYMLMQGLY